MNHPVQEKSDERRQSTSSSCSDLSEVTKNRILDSVVHEFSITKGAVKARIGGRTESSQSSSSKRTASNRKPPSDDSDMPDNYMKQIGHTLATILDARIKYKNRSLSQQDIRPDSESCIKLLISSKSFLKDDVNTDQSSIVLTRPKIRKRKISNSSFDSDDEQKRIERIQESAIDAEFIITNSLK
uniref:Uncharacterized protein n=1 Tax=Romanomermis culicivorax TaxID=13658 RepID=A0A915KVC5_ROMCU